MEIISVINVFLFIGFILFLLFVKAFLSYNEKTIFHIRLKSFIQGSSVIGFIIVIVIFILIIIDVKN